MKLLSGRELPDGRIEEAGVIRDFVKTDTARPLATPAVRAYVAAGRERIRAARGSACAACPAARVLGVGADGLTVRCAIERSLITEKGSPNSLGNLCLNREGYVGCETWRREKERIWADRRDPLVAESEGV